jgi:acyl-CoA dehydrogenase
MTPLAIAGDLIEATRHIAETVAAPAADAVDREARFPHEAIAALREERMLGALVPRALGGSGATIGELAACCEVLGRSCASTAMIFAMHQIEVACLVRHAHSSAFFRNYLAGLATHQWLIASATSEIGTGGDLRRSVCAVERDGPRIHVTKEAPIISYGEEADDILLTARRAPEAAPGDQVLVLARKADLRLTRTSGWDTLGMRGTRSLGFTLEVNGSLDQILPVPFAEIAGHTMLPVSHVLWTSLWLGLASDAVDRARAFVRVEARRTPGTVPPAALRLAETVAELEMLRATVHGGLHDFEQHQDDRDALEGLGFAIRMNNLKASAARLAPEIVARALAVCGVSGYRCDSPYSVGRHLRDAYGAALMIGNDRILSANASMLLLHKEEIECRPPQPRT